MLAASTATSSVKILRSKFSFGHVKCSFDNPATKFSLKNEKKNRHKGVPLHTPNAVLKVPDFCYSGIFGEQIHYSESF